MSALALKIISYLSSQNNIANEVSTTLLDGPIRRQDHQQQEYKIIIISVQNFSFHTGECSRNGRLLLDTEWSCRWKKKFGGNYCFQLQGLTTYGDNVACCGTASSLAQSRRCHNLLYCHLRVRLAIVAVGTNQPLPKLLTSFLPRANHSSRL
jgi:hypothetical protein